MFSNLFEYLLALRCVFEGFFSKILPEPQASLLCGIVLGAGKSLPFDFYRNLKITGTLHIVVASGMNISIFAKFLVNFFAGILKRKVAVLISLFFVFIYCVIAGMNPPIVRAGLMAASGYLAVLLGREEVGVNGLIFAAALMLCFDPMLLVDVSFQLSFLATFGLITVSSSLRARLDRIGILSFCSLEFAETIAAQVFTAPVLIINFGHLNPMSVVPNIFVLFLVPYIMALGGLIIIFGFLCFPLAYFLGLLAWLPLTYFVQIIMFFGRFRLFYFEFPKITWVFTLGYYFILIGFLFRRRFRHVK